MDSTMGLNSNIMDLPCEVLVDILSRLSLKHVHQLQIVSKLWHRTISSPYFRRLYNIKSSSRRRARVVQVPNFKYSSSRWEMISRTIIISILDLVVDNSEIQEEFSFEDIIAPQHSFTISSNLIIFNNKVCNPTTKEIVDIPIPSNPSVSFDVAYIPSNNTYKIVHLYGTKTGYDYNFNHGGSHVEFRFEILTLRDGGPIPNSWRILTNQEWFSCKIDSICVNGVIHWLVERGDTMKKYIFSMEIESEEFMSSISCPNNPYVGEISIWENTQLVDLNGKLCLSYFSEELSLIDLYFVKNQKNQEWIKEYTINLLGIGSWPRIIGCGQLQGNINGDIIIDGEQLILFNIEENRRLYNIKSLSRPRARVLHVPNFMYSMSWWETITQTIIISTLDLAIDNSEMQEEFRLEVVIAPKLYSFTISSNLIIFNNKVCNPTTKEIIDIPIPSNPSVSFDVAYIPSNNTYKIVHLYCTKIDYDYKFNHDGSPVEFRFEILTLRDGGPIPNSWRGLEHQEWFASKVDSTCVNGIIHWLVERGDGMKKCIFSMEIESEEFMSSIDCPSNPYVGGNVQLADVNGKLCLAYYSEELSRMDLYFVKYLKNQEWVKEHTIHLSGMGSWSKIMGCIQLQGKTRDIIIDGQQFILYNIEENRLTRLPKHKMMMHIGLYFDRCFKLENTRLSMQPSVGLLSK
ncbi:hypothetical protein HAX54_006704 [Datura stramonium]|uniref:F-box domain-containing protein n=1 Tax=Datura stramonium TaxID=4076 RepID=A0ABS8RV62_DATST|nr:hypothetical protein [Datura stramonium]